MLREILRPRPHIIGRRLLIIVIRDVGASCAARSFGVLSAAAVVELGGIRGIIRSQLIVPSRAEQRMQKLLNPPSSEQLSLVPTEITHGVSAIRAANGMERREIMKEESWDRSNQIN